MSSPPIGTLGNAFFSPVNSLPISYPKQLPTLGLMYHKGSNESGGLVYNGSPAGYIALVACFSSHAIVPKLVTFAVNCSPMYIRL